MYVYKEDKRYLNLYAVWFYKNRLYYERVNPVFGGLSYRILFAGSKRVKSVEEMKTDAVACLLDK